MNALRRVLVFTVLAVSAVAAQQPTSAREQKSADVVVQVEERWLQAFSRGDRKVLDELMPEDFMATTPVGDILGKSKLIPPHHAVQALPKFRLVGPVTHIYGDVAVLMGRLVDERGGVLSTTSVFRRSGNQWKIIASQLSPLPK